MVMISPMMGRISVLREISISIFGVRKFRTGFFTQNYPRNVTTALEKHGEPKPRKGRE